MEILETNLKENEKKELYLMTEGAEVTSIKDVDNNTVIKAVKYVEYMDIDHKGNDVHLLSIMDSDGNVFATNSETFIKSFNRIIKVFGDVVDIKKISGITKNDKPYVNVTIA